MLYHLKQFTINIVIDSAGTKRIYFLLPRSTGKTLNKLRTTKVNIVIMLIDMFMAFDELMNTHKCDENIHCN